MENVANWMVLSMYAAGMLLLLVLMVLGVVRFIQIVRSPDQRFFRNDRECWAVALQLCVACVGVVLSLSATGADLPCAGGFVPVNRPALSLGHLMLLATVLTVALGAERAYTIIDQKSFGIGAKNYGLAIRWLNRVLWLILNLALAMLTYSLVGLSLRPNCFHMF